jgi:hypothetical protein
VRTAEELEKIAKERFSAAGLMPDLVEDKSQFLDLPGELFAEIVVRNGSKVRDFRQIMADLGSGSEQKFDVIVRPLWQIESVGDPRIAYSPDTGAPRAAEQFPVDLRSGDAKQRVWVDVTFLAGKVFEENGIDTEGVKRIIADLIGDQLRKGGESYWDAIRFPHLEINGDTASFLASRSLQALTKRPAV